MTNNTIVLFVCFRCFRSGTERKIKLLMRGKFLHKVCLIQEFGVMCVIICLCFCPVWMCLLLVVCVIFNKKSLIFSSWVKVYILILLYVLPEIVPVISRIRVDRRKKKETRWTGPCASHSMDHEKHFGSENGIWAWVILQKNLGA